MQVILTQNVANLGSLGDSVKVKDGYARNFLLPRGLALVHNAKKSSEIEHQRKRLEQLRQVAIEQAKTESEKVAGMELTVKARSGANGRLFGSVTNRDVQSAMAEKGYELDRRSIQLHEAIKQVGTFTATVRLHTDVKVEVTIHVKPDFVTGTPPVEGEEGADAAEGTDAAAPEDGTEATTGKETDPTESGDAEPAVDAAPADEPTQVSDQAPETATDENQADAEPEA